MNSPILIHLKSTVRRSPDPVSSEIEDDLVILSVERGRYYGTELVGQRIWSMLTEPMLVESLCDALMQEFDVERPDCEQDVLAFLGQLQQEGLIEVK